MTSRQPPNGGGSGAPCFGGVAGGVVAFGGALGAALGFGGALGAALGGALGDGLGAGGAVAPDLGSTPPAPLGSTRFGLSTGPEPPGPESPLADGNTL